MNLFVTNSNHVFLSKQQPNKDEMETMWSAEKKMIVSKLNYIEQPEHICVARFARTYSVRDFNSHMRLIHSQSRQTQNEAGRIISPAGYEN